MARRTERKPPAGPAVLRSGFQIAGRQLAPGERATLALQLPGQSAFTPLAMPLHVVHGREPGPVLFVSAAIHGDEIIGVEIIRRLRHLPALKRLRGTLICIPVVNMYGFLNHTRYLPDRRDLNRSFPGSARGSLAGRIANVFAREIVAHASHGIDLHTGGNHRTNLPHVRVSLQDREAERLARAFGEPRPEARPTRRAPSESTPEHKNTPRDWSAGATPHLPSRAAVPAANAGPTVMPIDLTADSSNRATARGNDASMR